MPVCVCGAQWFDAVCVDVEFCQVVLPESCTEKMKRVWQLHVSG